MQNYSVLMSVYHKEKPEYLRQAIESIQAQTLSTNDFVLVCDGPLNEPLDSVIAAKQQEMGESLNVVRLAKNGGLGNALNEGIKHCKNELVARMDSDDIAYPDRCEKQIAVFNTHSEVSICSGIVEEFTTDPHTVDTRRVPPESMKTELIFLWIEWDENGCFQKMNFNFSPCYKLEFDYKSARLIIRKTEKTNIFDEGNVQNLTAIIGENGVGKTTLIKYITELQKTKEDKSEYDIIKNGKSIYTEKSFLAVYEEKRDAEVRLKIVNALASMKEIEVVDLSEAGYQMTDRAYTSRVSHICLSNSAYGTGKDNIERGRIDYITLMDYAVQLRYTRDIDDDLKAQIENSWKEFKLQELYEQHSDYIRDILRTNYIYNDAYFESLVEQFPTLFVDAAEAKNLVYFNYLDEKDWGKRILAKLTHDLEADDS